MINIFRFTMGQSEIFKNPCVRLSVSLHKIAYQFIFKDAISMLKFKFSGNPDNFYKTSRLICDNQRK
ncbi:hypothetical protein OENI_70162 [Oenococcus oeni]|nr:hypothetical protein OENI_70162 [Oenococcus oeni]